MNGEIDIDTLTNCIKSAVINSNNEEELAIGVSNCIEEHVLKPLQIPRGRYQYRILISGARVDALYGHVIIEFKSPGGLSTKSKINSAKEQIIYYITDESNRNPEEMKRYIGIIISDRIAFVRYDWRNNSWLLRGPYDINRQSVIKLVEAIRGLRKKDLNVDNLVAEFGPKTSITMKIVRELYCLLSSHINTNTKIKMLFDDWYRLFIHATGYNTDKLEDLEKEYNLGTDVNREYLLFSIHTYYSLLIKLIAAEIVYLYAGGKLLSSYVSKLDHEYTAYGLEGLRNALNELETGYIFKNLMNITNFLEGDYFSWYLDVLNEPLADSIAELVRRLNDYEIATPQLEPEFTKDLLKKLYQYLMPRDIRHSLGEYYTPDWLADYLLEEVGLTADKFERNNNNSNYQPIELRILDPACGSGTFLVAYIKQLRRYAEEHFMLDSLADDILENVVGYDLNPIAVLTAKTNYLLMIGDLLVNVKRPIEIPIYLTDSLQIGRTTTVQDTVYRINTVVGDFEFPTDIVDNSQLLTDILREIEGCLKNKYSVEDFVNRIKDKLKLNDTQIYYLGQVYSKLLELDKENKNGIWLTVIRNSLAPLKQGKFDYVIGNPPWVNWENIAKDYRDRIKNLYKEYGILPKNINAATKIDLSMLFVYRCIDKYLKDDGYLAFLINDAAFKAMAGNGFRRFTFKDGNTNKYFKLLKVYDLVDINPFEATNRTAMFIVKNGEKTQYPIPYMKWSKANKNAQISTDLSLNEVKRLVTIDELIAEPYKKDDEVYPFMVSNKEASNLKNMLGVSSYKAHEGASLNPSTVFRVKIICKRNDGKLIIENSTHGKTKVNVVKVPIEKDFVYPILESKDVEKWQSKYDTYAIIAHYGKENEFKPIDENTLKIDYPYTFKYLAQFEQELKGRADYRAYGKNKPYYFVYRFVEYILTPYKVAWNRMGNRLNAAVITPVTDEYLGAKPLIPEDVIAYIPIEETRSSLMDGYSQSDRIDNNHNINDYNPEDEAHYICAILNSTPVNQLLQSIAKGGKNFATPNHINCIKIDKYNSTNNLHKRLAELSKNAHEAKRNNDESLLKEIEIEIDNIVKELYNINKIDNNVSMDVEVQELNQPSVNILNTVLQPDTNNKIEIYVSNPTGKEFNIELEFPWSKHTIVVNDGTYFVDIPPLGEGSYKAKLRWRFNDIQHEEEFSIEVKSSIPKRRFSSRLI